MSNLKSNIFVFLIIGLIQTSWSQGSGSSLQKLSEAVIQNNPKIEQVTIQKQMQLEEVDQVGVLPDPMVSYSWFGENVETRVGPQEQKFGIQQKIPWLGKLSDQKELKRKKAEITESMISGTKATLIYKMRNTWAQIQYMHLYKGVIDSTIILYQRWSKTLLSDYKAGKTSYSRVLKMESEIEILEDEKNTVQRILKDQNQTLKELTNEDGFDEIQEEVSFLTIALQEGNELLPESFESNFNLRKAKAQKLFWKQKKQLSQNGYLPDFTVGLGYIQTGEAQGMPESGKDPWLINVGMTLPISFGKTSAQIRESGLGVKKAHSFEKEQDLFLNKNAEVALNQLKESIRKRELYEGSLLKRLEQSISVLESQYQAGNQNFMQLLDDYRQRLILKKKVYMTISKEFQAKAKILWLLGDESTEFAFPYQIPAEQKGE